MPNWCEGMLKIRGRQENVFNILADNLQVWKTIIVKEPNFDMREELDREAIRINREDGTICVNKTAYIKDTHRNFIEPNEINVWASKDGNSCVAVEFKAAWDVVSEPYVKLSKAYNVDIKIEAFEKGMEFSRYILIESGELKEDKEITYDDYVWDCVMPNLGG
nr:MAG TPA: Ferredoxin-like domain in Api92-like protein [Bacteriophage sp.]